MPLEDVNCVNIVQLTEYYFDWLVTLFSSSVQWTELKKKVQCVNNGDSVMLVSEHLLFDLVLRGTAEFDRQEGK